MNPDLQHLPLTAELSVDLFAVPGGEPRPGRKSAPATESELLELHHRFRRYCLVEEGLRPLTVSSMERCMKTFIKRTQAERVSELTVGVLKEFFYEGRERYQWAYWTYMNHYKYLGKFLDWCVRRGEIRQNPLREIGKPKKPQALPRRLTHAEAQRLLYASFNHPWRYGFERSRNHAMIATLLFTGLRAAELLNLELTDVNLDASVLLVRLGKGAKDRYVPIHHKLRHILRGYLAERRRLGKTVPQFFTSCLKDCRLSYKALATVCRKLSRATGIRFTPHCLRHTFGSVAIEQDLGLVQLKEIMGHSNIASTMLYLRMSPQGLKSSLDRLDLF